jgi:hypothetical protein
MPDMHGGFVMVFGLLAMLGAVRNFRGLDPLEFLRKYPLDRYLQVQSMLLGGLLLLLVGAALLAGRAP